MLGDAQHGLSLRSTRACQPALTYQLALVEAFQNQWSQENPTGFIIATVAENCLSIDLLLERLLLTKPPPPSALRYNDARGIPQLRTAVASFFEQTFMSGVQVDPNHITALTGVGSVLDTLTFILCDPGDVVLIPAPYYPAFDNDLAVRNALVPTPFEMVTGEGEEALLASLEAGLSSADGTVRCLLLTNPSNPLGTIYPQEDLRTIVNWARRHNLHLISDEIYALSCFDTDPSNAHPPFVSMAQVINGSDQETLEWAADYVHILWALSKDFGASGLRAGFLYSRSPGVMKAMFNLGYFATISGTVQWQVAEVLEDHDWVKFFIAENCRRLHNTYNDLLKDLGRYGIPYERSYAGMFCWLNLSDFLPEKTFAAERALWQQLVNEAQVLFTPGEACHAKEPGYFRCCFSWVPAEALPIMVQRIAAVLKLT